MPTECFFNLPEEKKLRILGAAMCELSNVPADKISINKITGTAGISRGSFYQYFVDKNDLISYIFREYRNRIKSFFIENLHKYDGDIFKMIEYIFEAAESECTCEHTDMLKNFFLSLRYTRNVITDFLEKFDISPEFFVSAIQNCKNANSFRSTDEQYLANLMEMLTLTLKQSLTDLFCDRDNAEACRKDFHTKLNIIRYGAIKAND